MVVATVAWGLLFGLGPRHFWLRACIAGLAIAGYAAVAQRRRLDDLLRPTVPDVALGVAAAVGLYALFWVGDRVLGRIAPDMAAEIGQLYSLRAAAGRGRWVPLVLVVVGASEEVFWRGLVQARAGVLVGLAAYAAVHLWERKAVLVLAAAVAGGVWAALFAWRGRLVAPIVCHALWDLAVVVWFPFRGPEPGPVESGS